MIAFFLNQERAIAFFLYRERRSRFFFIHCIGKVRSQQKSQPAPNKIPTAFLKNLWETAFAVESFHRTKHLAPLHIHLDTEKEEDEIIVKILMTAHFNL